MTLHANFVITPCSKLFWVSTEGRLPLLPEADWRTRVLGPATAIMRQTAALVALLLLGGCSAVSIETPYYRGGPRNDGANASSVLLFPGYGENMYAPRGRALATSCTPSTANGVWTGSPPALAQCGNYWWTGATGSAMAVFETAEWTLGCNSGYARFGSNAGTCTGAKSCSYDSALGYGSCSSVCSYTCTGCSW